MSNRGRRGGGAAAMYAARMTDEIEVDPADNPLLAASDDEPEPVVDDEPEYEDDPEPEPHIDTSHEDDADDEDPAPVVVDPVADLRKQLADLKAEREAEKAQRQTDDEAATIRGHQAAVTDGHRRAKQALADTKAAFAAAAAAGNHAAMAEAQAEIAQITLDIRDFETAADELAAAAKRPKQVKPAAAANDDPFEAYIAPMGDEAKAWMRTNKADLLKSPARGAKAQAAHLEAVESGIKPDTAEYFAFLDKTMGYKTPMAKPTKQPKPAGKPRVAAPGGGSSGAPGGGRVEVKLSRDEAAIARSMFPGDPKALKRYADRKAEIIQNGKDPRRGGPVYTAQQPGARR